MREGGLNVLRALGIGDVAGQPAHALAAGHQRMVEIARAAVAHPRALLLDEPAAGLASFEIDLLLDCVWRMRDAGIGILLVEHHLEMVMSIADVITVLDSGRTIASGPPAAVKQSPAVVAAYLGTDFAH